MLSSFKGFLIGIRLLWAYLGLCIVSRKNTVEAYSRRQRGYRGSMQERAYNRGVDSRS